MTNVSCILEFTKILNFLSGYISNELFDVIYPQRRGSPHSNLVTFQNKLINKFTPLCIQTFK